MAKTKTTLGTNGIKSNKDAQVKAISSVKTGAVTKPSQTPKSKSKEMAKQVATKADKGGKVDKKSKKTKKEPTPEPSSDESESDEEMSSASSASSDDEPDAKMKPAVKANGVKANGSAKPAAVVEDESSDSSSSSDDENEPTTTKSAATPAAKKETAAKVDADSEDDSEDDSEEDSDEDDSEESADDTPAAAGAIDHKAVNGALKKVTSKDASSDEESDSEESGSGSEEDSSEDDSAEEETPAPKKRKAEADAVPIAKKPKTEAVGDDASKKNLFVGSLSWNVDEDWLTREFESFGELSGVRVITDKATGRSKGFGYVEFVKPEDGIKAQKAMHGALVDNRALNVDFSTPKDKPDRGSDRSKQYGDQKSPASDTLFVANIAFEATEDIIGEEFGKHGDVISVRLPTDMESGNPKGFGYVQFSSIEGATGAMDKMAGASICGRPIRLDFSAPRASTGDSPRGGRGGRGGFDRGGRGGGRGRGGSDRGGRGGGRGGRGGRGGSTNRGGFGDFQGKKMTF